MKDGLSPQRPNVRFFARQIAKCPALGQIALPQKPPTRMEQKFAEDMGIKLLDLPLGVVMDRVQDLEVAGRT